MVEFVSRPIQADQPAVPPPDSEILSRVFSALSDPTRRGILTCLRAGDATIGTLADPFDMSLAAVSKHVQVLERAGLVSREKRGREQVVSLEAEPLRQATTWTVQYQDFWHERLDVLESLLTTQRETRKAETKTSKRKPRAQNKQIPRKKRR